MSILRTIVQAGAFASIASMFIVRARSVKQVANSLKTNKMEASKLIGTPTWKRSVWQRGPAATLLQQKKPPLPRVETKVVIGGDQTKI
jgi:hypothetical protein